MPEPGPKEAVKLVASAGGEIVGRTRLQKIGCLLELAGANFGFRYEYHIYGPYSEQLSVAASDADALGLVQVEDRTADWGGRYSIYRAPVEKAEGLPGALKALGKTAAGANSIELELAVTAAFIARDGHPDPWNEVAFRKKAKATEGRIANAKKLYQLLARSDLPNPLPNI
jgi:uncharacterized protein